MQALSRMIRTAPDNGLQRKIRFIRLPGDRKRRFKKPSGLLAVFLIAALGWLPTGCSSPNSGAPASDQAHSGRYANPAYSASAAFHGTEVNVSGTDGCISCHGRDLAGTETVPGCTDCHFDARGSRVPPGSGWTHGSDQHLDFAGVQAVCNRCHDAFRRFDMPPAYCHDCHGPGINHVLGRPWLDRSSLDFHGSADRTDCGSCHDLAAKCTECHFGSGGSKSPPSSGWNHGNNTAHQNFSADQSVCNLCHALDRSYGYGPVACHDCHALVSNHELGQLWLDTKSASFHGSADLSECSSCHYLDTDCHQCHFGPDGSMSPPGSSWNHGNNAEHRSFEAYRGICNQCHIVNRSYGNPPPGCHDCHED